MGAVYEDLDGHEGYAMRRLHDGTISSAWTAEAAAFSSYVAACECNWRGGDHAPTEEGYDEAVEEWDSCHARPLVAQAIPNEVKLMLREMKQVLAELVDKRPIAGLKAVLEDWSRAVGARAMGAEHAARARSSHSRPDRRRLGL